MIHVATPNEEIGIITMTGVMGTAAVLGALYALLEKTQGGKIEIDGPGDGGYGAAVRDRIKEIKEAELEASRKVDVERFQSGDCSFTWHTSYDYWGFVPFSNGSTAKLGATGWHLSSQVELILSIGWVRVKLTPTEGRHRREDEDQGEDEGQSDIWMISKLNLRIGSKRRLPMRNSVKLKIEAYEEEDQICLTFSWTEEGAWKTFATSASLTIPFNRESEITSSKEFKEALGGGWDELTNALKGVTTDSSDEAEASDAAPSSSRPKNNTRSENLFASDSSDDSEESDSEESESTEESDDSEESESTEESDDSEESESTEESDDSEESDSSSSE